MMLKIAKFYTLTECETDNPAKAAEYGDYHKLVSLVMEGKDPNNSWHGRTSLMFASSMPKEVNWPAF